MAFDLSKVSLFLTISWGIWKYRNLKVFEQTKELTQQVVDNCIDYVTHYTFIKTTCLIMRNEKVLQWKPSPCGKLKLNLD